jgi:hypothetical protein
MFFLLSSIVDKEDDEITPLNRVGMKHQSMQPLLLSLAAGELLSGLCVPFGIMMCHTYLSRSEVKVKVF